MGSLHRKCNSCGSYASRGHHPNHRSTLVGGGLFSTSWKRPPILLGRPEHPMAGPAAPPAGGPVSPPAPAPGSAPSPATGPRAPQRVGGGSGPNHQRFVKGNPTTGAGRQPGPHLSGGVDGRRPTKVAWHGMLTAPPGSSLERQVGDREANTRALKVSGHRRLAGNKFIGFQQ